MAVGSGFREIRDGIKLTTTTVPRHSFYRTYSDDNTWDSEHTLSLASHPHPTPISHSPSTRKRETTLAIFHHAANDITAITTRPCISGTTSIVSFATMSIQLVFFKT